MTDTSTKLKLKIMAKPKVATPTKSLSPKLTDNAPSEEMLEIIKTTLCAISTASITETSHTLPQ